LTAIIELSSKRQPKRNRTKVHSETVATIIAVNFFCGDSKKEIVMKTQLVPVTTSGNDAPPPVITDKRGYAERWSFSPRHIDNLLAAGLPHLKVGQRRVRIVIADADTWMKQKFQCQRNGRAS
jgi:hypothetical protein